MNTTSLSAPEIDGMSCVNDHLKHLTRVHRGSYVDDQIIHFSLALTKTLFSLDVVN